MVDHEGTKAERRARLANLAEEAFTDHVLTKEGDGRWYCGKPTTGIYSFRVITAPGCVFLYGDIDELALLPHDRDALTWLRGSINDMDYVLGKSSLSVRQKDFLVAEAESCLVDEVETGGLKPDVAAGIREQLVLSRYDEPERTWHEAWSDAGEADIPACTDWGSQMIWQYHALRAFLRLLDADRDESLR
jgi:hypothetical protein